MSGPVKWFSSQNFNAPQLTNTWGDLVHALKTCLIDGFGEQDIISVVISDGVGVATFANNHNLQIFQWIKLSGSSQVVLNAEFKVLGLTQNTVEFLVELPDQTITETLSCRLAPLGWSMPFSDTGRAVFQAKDTSKNPYYLRVDDTCDPLHTPTRAKFAKVGILESCTGIDDISGNQAPFDPVLPTKNWIGTGTAGTTSAIIGWARWVYATSDTTGGGTINLGGTAIEGVRGWILVGNDENFFILPTTLPEHLTTTYSGYSVCYGFGIFDGKDCPFLSARHDYSALSSSGYSGADSTFSGQVGGYLLLLKNRDGTYVTGAAVNANETRMNYGIDSSGFTGYADAYIKNQEDGVYHCNFHARDVQKAYLGVIPLLRCVLNSTLKSEPPTAIFSENGNAYIKRKHMGSSIRHGSIIINLGEI
ncbi:hypothetical protein [Acinetobacter sp. ANC 5378]|uniref:hypothetical protein n=1 Tax=Acinetobacter sp. ANC 5378 TaxID=2731249 RepID=UPI00148FFEA1|nr:hypothetical protein [Acinetobacter sp. ANC 5378]NNG80617.1 hypothetical protein [Acinetobacter sp. ANC 5378]